MAAVHFDDILPEIGGPRSRYHRLMLFCVIFPACLPGGFFQFNQLFLAEVLVGRWCQNQSDSLYLFSRNLCSNCSTPKESANVSAFLVESSGANDFNVSVSQRSMENPAAHANIASDFNRIFNYWEPELIRERSLQTGWSRDSQYAEEKQWWPLVSRAGFLLGAAAGLPASGYLCDRYGRKRLYFIGLGIQTIFLVASGFVYNIYAWMVFQFFLGGTILPTFNAAVTIGFELVAPASRPSIVVLSSIFQISGASFCVLVAYFVSDWQLVQMIISASTVLLLALCCFYTIFVAPNMLWNNHRQHTVPRDISPFMRKGFPIRFVQKRQKKVSNNFLSPFHTTLRFSKGYATEETFWPMSLRYKPYFDFQSKLAHFSQPQTFLESAQNALEPVLRNLNARFWVENECPMVLEAELPLHLPPNRPKFLKSLLEGVADDDNYLNAKLFEDVPCSFRIFFSACKFIQRFMPESPRWMLLHEKYDETERFIQSVAKTNRKPVARNYLRQVREESQATLQAGRRPQQKGTFCDLLGAEFPHGRRKALLLLAIWCAVSPFLYHTFDVPLTVFGDVRIDALCTLTSLVAVMLSIWPLAAYCGRRVPLSLFLLHGGCFWILLGASPHYLPSTLQPIAYLFYGLAKYSSVAIFVILLIYTVELFPTCVVGAGLGSVQAVGLLLAAVLRAFVDMSALLFPDALPGSLPVMIVYLASGSLMMSASVCALALPETFQTRLSPGLDDAEDLGCPMTCGEIFSFRRPQAEAPPADHDSVKSWVFDELPDRAEYRRSMISNIMIMDMDAEPP